MWTRTKYAKSRNSKTSKSKTQKTEKKKKEDRIVVAPPATPPQQSKPVPPVLAPTTPEAKIHSPTTVIPATPNSTLSAAEKWPGEDTAKMWMETVDYPKAKAEYDKIQTMAVAAEECKQWKANRQLNQSPPDDYPILDSNIVTLEKGYVNMSQVDVQLQQPKLYMGQFPTKGNEEAFWKAVFEKKVSFMTIITDPESPIDFFPLNNGDHVYHATMFVNNRKVEVVGEDVIRYLIEVLPEGCSNSIMCNINVIKHWPAESVHKKQSVVVKEVIELNNFLGKLAKEEYAMVVSRHGAGRAGYFIALATAIFKLDNKIEPPIYDIVKSLRAQRPKSVKSLTQYASLYTTLLYYVKIKIVRPNEKKAATEMEDPVSKKVAHLTTIFADALMQEMNAAAGRTTVTMPPIK